MIQVCGRRRGGCFEGIDTIFAWCIMELLVRKGGVWKKKPLTSQYSQLSSRTSAKILKIGSGFLWVFLFVYFSGWMER